MKKIIFSTILLYALSLPIIASAAGSMTVTYKQLTGNVSKLTVNWIADTDGTVPTGSTSTDDAILIKGMMAQVLDTKPGNVQPTNGYTVKMKNALGIDLLGNKGASLSSTTTARNTVLVGDVYGVSPIDENGVTFEVTGNSVNGANGIIEVYILR